MFHLRWKKEFFWKTKTLKISKKLFWDKRNWRRIKVLAKKPDLTRCYVPILGHLSAVTSYICITYIFASQNMPTFVYSGKRKNCTCDLTFYHLEKHGSEPKQAKKRPKSKLIMCPEQKFRQEIEEYQQKSFCLEDRKISTGTRFVFLEVCGISENFWGLPFVGLKSFGEA